MKIIFALLIALASPIILLPIEHIFNYPYIIEELVKFVAVILILSSQKNVRNGSWIFVILIGVLFTISESILYFVNFLLDGTFSLLFTRLILTGVLHSSTCLLMYLFGRKSWWMLIIGFVISILIHYYFNQVISSINAFQ